MFGEPGTDFLQSWGDFIVWAVIFMGALFIFGQFMESRRGKKTGSTIQKIVSFIAYPFYKFRSILPQRGKEAFDTCLVLLYCVGAGWLILYSIT